MTGESAAAQAEIDPNGGFLSVSAVRPSGAAINYAVLTRQGSAAFEKIGVGDFIPSCVLANDIGKTEVVLNVLYGVDLDLVALDTYAQLDGELVVVKAVNVAAGTVTVDRGVLDTVPARHSAGARLYFVEGGQFYNTTQYLSGETVQTKVLPATGMGVLAEASAPAINYTFAKRQIRPYTSWQAQQIDIPECRGYGMFYGATYGE